MAPRGPFDPVRASFLLVAFVVVVHALIALAGVGACLVYASEIVAGTFTCDAHGRLSELLAIALAAALAFSNRREDKQ
jgi:hypothetical protein